MSAGKLEQAGITKEDWMLLTNRPGAQEEEMVLYVRLVSVKAAAGVQVRLLNWFCTAYPGGGITRTKFQVHQSLLQ